MGSVFNVDKLFLSGFSQAAGVYTLGEGDTGSASSLCSLQGNMDGLLNYPMYYSLVDAFNDTDASMAGLLDQMASTRMQCKVRDVDVHDAKGVRVLKLTARISPPWARSARTKMFLDLRLIPKICRYVAFSPCFQSGYFMLTSRCSWPETS